MLHNSEQTFLFKVKFWSMPSLVAQPTGAALNRIFI